MDGVSSNRRVEIECALPRANPRRAGLPGRPEVDLARRGHGVFIESMTQAANQALDLGLARGFKENLDQELHPQRASTLAPLPYKQLARLVENFDR